jgi:hypothetical protein
MRLKVGRLGRPVEWDLPIEFGREQLTSYGGLELRRFMLQLIGLNQPAPRLITFRLRRLADWLIQIAELLDITPEVFSAGNLHQ